MDNYIVLSILNILIYILHLSVYHRALVNIDALAKFFASVHDTLQPRLALPVPLIQKKSANFFNRKKEGKFGLGKLPRIPIHRPRTDCGLRNVFYSSYNICWF